MRLLFLHAAWDGITPEYKVHTTLAGYAMARGVEPFFLWQLPIDTTDPYLKYFDSSRLISHDFGRNMSIVPRPSTYRRAGKILQRIPQALGLLISSIKQLEPDLLYTSQQRVDVQLANFLSKMFRIPHVIHIHYNVGPWLGRETFNTIRHSPNLIAISEYVRQTALLQGVPSSNIHTVVNPFPLVQHLDVKSAKAIDDEFGFSENTPLVVAVGRLDPGKGHLDLISAFEKVVKVIPSAQLLICGSSTTRKSYELALRQRVTELHIESSVTFAGHRNDVRSILGRANVFCLPTELEPFGLVFLEAMEAEVPIVAYHSGSVPEIVIHSRTGLLSYPNDIVALSENLIALLRNPSLARQQGQAGKERLLSEFLPEKIVGRWLDILHKKLNREY